MTVALAVGVMRDRRRCKKKSEQSSHLARLETLRPHICPIFVLIVPSTSSIRTRENLRPIVPLNPTTISGSGGKANETAFGSCKYPYCCERRFLCPASVRTRAVSATSSCKALARARPQMRRRSCPAVPDDGGSDRQGSLSQVPTDTLWNSYCISSIQAAIEIDRKDLQKRLNGCK